MALPTRLGNAGEGWHGDLAVQLKTSLGSIIVLVDSERSSVNDLLDKLDADTGVTDTDYAADLAVTAPEVELVNRVAAGNGGQMFSGDAGVITRRTVADLVILANEIRANFNDVLDKLDADVLVGDTDYASSLALNSPAAEAVNAEALNGGRSLHADEGVALREILQALIELSNEVKATQNDLLDKLDADAGVADTNYLSTLEISDPNAS